MLAPNTIIIWPGTNASIPENFSRVTGMDARMPKGWGIENPNVIGGSDSHSHTSPSHTHVINPHVHSITTNSAWEQDGNYEDNGHRDNDRGAHDHHFHNGPFSNYATQTGNLVGSTTYTAISENSLPPYRKVIFIKSDGWNAIPDGAIVLWRGTDTLPGGFYNCNGANGTTNLINKYLRGANTNGDGGATGGTLRHTHSVNHTHPSVSHVHYAQTVSNDNHDHLDLTSTSQRHASGNHSHRFTTSSATISAGAYNATYTSSSDVEPEYKKLMAIQNKSGNNKIPQQKMIVMWLGTQADVPIGYKVCNGSNGTIDMRNKHLKIAANASEIGNTGGSNTHSHAASNSHTHTATGSHNHGTGLVFAGETDPGYGTGVGSDHLARHGHHHKILSMTSVTATWQNATISANSVSSQPSYRTVVFLEFDFFAGGAHLLSLL